MAELLIKDLSEDTLRRLEERAKEHGRTIEAEAAAVLADVAVPPPTEPPPITMEQWIEGIQKMEWLADLDVREMHDGSDAGRATYISPEGIERLGELLRRD